MCSVEAIVLCTRWHIDFNWIENVVRLFGFDYEWMNEWIYNPCRTCSRLMYNKWLKEWEKWHRRRAGGCSRSNRQKRMNQKIIKRLQWSQLRPACVCVCVWYCEWNASKRCTNRDEHRARFNASNATKATNASTTITTTPVPGPAQIKCIQCIFTL